jgi:hypothetical protein
MANSQHFVTGGIKMKSRVIALTVVIAIVALPAYAQHENGDVDCSGGINLLDATYTINYLYKNGPEPCEIVRSGVVYMHYDSRVVNVGEYYEDLIGVAIDVPADGWVAVDFSFYVYTEAYCMQFALNYPSGPRGQYLITSTSMSSVVCVTRIPRSTTLRSGMSTCPRHICPRAIRSSGSRPQNHESRVSSISVLRNPGIEIYVSRSRAIL